MIEKVLNGKNLYKAYRQVVHNEGSAGVDGMKVHGTTIPAYESNRDSIAISILNHTYLPQPIKGLRYPRVTERLDCLESLR